MFDLFSNAPENAGYRLEYMEIYNWGTFDNNIYRISPNGNTSLLTGANGSGKTTYIDALLTLLVPIKKYRFYNRSSGTNKKNERTENSYVMGAIGDKQEEGKDFSKTIYLRPDKQNVYSILLATFKNDRDHPVTLFQVRWYFSGELKRAYGIARRRFTIEADFYPIDPRGDWKKILKKHYPPKGLKETVMFFDTSVKYANKLIKLFGMRSEKALSLFNQTVGIKVLGNLDHFIRNNMLEPQESEEEFAKLKENYDTLLEAHKQIEKADAQARLLTPIRDLNRQVEEISNQLKELEQLEETRDVYFNSRLIQLITEEIGREEHALEITRQKKENVESRLENWREEENSLLRAIETDETGKRLKDINREITRGEKEKSKRISKQKEYNNLAALLQLTGSPDEPQFFRNIEQAQQQQKLVEKNAENIESRKFEQLRTQGDNKTEYDAIEKEVKQLNNQKSKITGRTSEIRDEILRHVKASPDEIPFIGELIKVKSAQADWEPAIEKLLHNFALRLLVPDTYYRKVNQYVNQNNLRGRIVYHHVKEESFMNAMKPRPSGIVLDKLDLKKSVYRDWVENQLLTHYNYICIDHVSEIGKYNRALTREGLIKNKDRHQKDDRPGIGARERYVLGWDNKEKIKILVQKAVTLQKELRQNEEQLKKIQRESKQLKTKQDNIVRFLTFNTFDDIDWKSIAVQIEELESERNKLEKTSDKIKQLQQQLNEVKARVKKLDKEREEIIKNLGRIEETIKTLKNSREECQRELNRAPFPHDRFQERFAIFENRYPNLIEQFSYVNRDHVRKNLEKEQANNKEKWTQQRSKKNERLFEKMNNFKNPGAEIIERFPDWLADTHKLPQNTMFADEYISMLEKIEKEDLPSYRRKFQEYLSSTMINKIAGFNEFLDSGETAIDENITILNRSLEKISFRKNPETFIQLKYPQSSDVNIRAFKNMLKDAIPDITRLTTDDSGDYKKKIFKEIQKLIDKLHSDENWRKRVIDVRNWKNYYAEEYYREDKSPMKVYKDMEKLSGGEKAQLTYTILGSAIAYQFGIKHDGKESDSFRFIAVDETFSNQDDERATYLMDLCGQLHLQLLVVTPSDKIHIVEDYISYVHYVKRRNNRDSILFDMPILQFKEKKKQMLLAESKEEIKI